MTNLLDINDFGFFQDPSLTSGIPSKLNYRNDHAVQNEFDEDSDSNKIFTMPTDFYQSVDSFLSKAPPKFSSIKDSTIKNDNDSVVSKKKLKVDDATDNSVTKRRVKKKSKSFSDQPLPASVGNDNNNNNTLLKTSNNDQSNSKRNSKIKSGADVGKDIDYGLLQKAFAYTENLLRNAINEEHEEAAINTAAGTFCILHTTSCLTIPMFR